MLSRRCAIRIRVSQPLIPCQRARRHSTTETSDRCLAISVLPESASSPYITPGSVLGGTRIPNLLIRSQMLCPIELPAYNKVALYL